MMTLESRLVTPRRIEWSDGDGTVGIPGTRCVLGVTRRIFPST